MPAEATAVSRAVFLIIVVHLALDVAVGRGWQAHFQEICLFRLFGSGVGDREAEFGDYSFDGRWEVLGYLGSEKFDQGS
jgi:hypothetical protein